MRYNVYFPEKHPDRRPVYESGEMAPRIGEAFVYDGIVWRVRDVRHVCDPKRRDPEVQVHVEYESADESGRTRQSTSFDAFDSFDKSLGAAELDAIEV